MAIWYMRDYKSKNCIIKIKSNWLCLLIIHLCFHKVPKNIFNFLPNKIVDLSWLIQFVEIGVVRLQREIPLPSY